MKLYVVVANYKDGSYNIIKVASTKKIANEIVELNSRIFTKNLDMYYSIHKADFCIE